MTQGNCGACQKWDVFRPIAPGFGHCNGRPEPWRSAVSTAAHVECRIGLFVAKNPVEIAVGTENEKKEPSA